MRKLYTQIIAVIFFLLFAGSLTAQPFTPIHTGLISSFGTWTYTNTNQRTGDATQGDCVELFSGSAGSITSPSMDFTTCASTPYLTFKILRRGSDAGKAQIGIEVSTAGAGGPWTLLGNIQPSSNTIWAGLIPVDLSAYSGNTNVMIRLISNGGARSNKYPIVDDIHIYCATPPANDDCTGAINLVPGGPGACTPTAGTVNYASLSSPLQLVQGLPMMMFGIVLQQQLLVMLFKLLAIQKLMLLLNYCLVLAEL